MDRLIPSWAGAAEVNAIMAALGAPLTDARFVGGCVRDAVLGRDRAGTEIDIGTPDPPERVLARLKAVNIKAIPTGLDHGTITALIGSRPFEITSLRRDTACDGRHAAVEFTTDWREDMRRRDFTMNAMSLSLDGTLHDDHGGLADARAGRVRFVGRPADRIQEDYLRILRLFRFAAYFGKEPIEAETLAACAAHGDGLARLSAERIRQELAKLLAASDPTSALRQMQVCGILVRVLPEAGFPDESIGCVARLVAAEASVGISAEWVRRLAGVIPRASPAAVAQRLKLSHAEQNRMALLLAPMPQCSPGSGERTWRHALYELGAPDLCDRLLLAWAFARGLDEAAVRAWRALVVRTQAATVPRLPVTGADVLALNVPAGPQVGRILATMTEWWIDRAFAPSRAEALQYLAKVAAESS